MLLINIFIYNNIVSVSASQQNIHLLNKLLRQLQVMIDCACWGRPLGSTQLWENHLVTINRILAIANRIQIREVIESFKELGLLNILCAMFIHLYINHIISFFSRFLIHLLYKNKFKTFPDLQTI